MIFAVLAAALWTARLGMFVALHIVRSDYSPVKHAVSDYAVGRTRTLSSIMTWTTAGGWGALAAAVWFGLPEWSDRVGVAAWLGVLAVIFVALPFVPTTLEGEEMTTIGRLHMLAAVAWFAISYSCMGNFVRLAESTVGGGLAATLSVLSVVTMVALVALIGSLVLPWLRSRTFGIAERVFIVAVNVFYLIVAIMLLLG
ncbi:DUF998 domain-containing protein [Microbacterium sp. LWH10-1.2]|uniref:DUF998 domain-containing protein n=1 Tax=Microbacterium sp. LWH10-1.2 TaxID=3135255 RepID=UPI003138B660